MNWHFFFDKKVDPGFVQILEPLKDRIQHIVVLPAYAKCTKKDLINLVVPALRKHLPESKIGGGTDAFFTELNRERTPASSLDFLTFSVNPQVHAFDNSSLTETLAMHGDVVRSCREFANGKDIHVGPITFKMRWNPNATGRDAEQLVNGLPKSADARQISLYGAAWTMGSFKYLAESNVSAISYYETCGWKGLMPHPLQVWPEKFLFSDHDVYPIYILLKNILAQKHRRILRLTSSDPLTVDGLAMADNNGNEMVMLANYTQSPQQITMPSTFKLKKMWSLNSENILSALENAGSEKAQVTFQGNSIVTLPPFGICALY